MNLIKAFTIFVVVFIVGCSGSGGKNPVVPETQSESKALALYTMTYNPSVVIHNGDRSVQADHGYVEVLINEGNVPFNGGKFALEGKVIDYDRQINVLTVDFTVTEVSETPPLQIFDPRLVFYFNNYAEDGDGTVNEPKDPYQLMNPDVLVNIDQTGNSIDVAQNANDAFFPALRLMKADPHPYVLFQTQSRTVTAKIRIPSESDDSNPNYEPIQWDILIEGTIDQPPIMPHLDAIDITSQVVAGIIEQGEQIQPKALRLTVTYSEQFSSAAEVAANFEVQAWLDPFNQQTNWVPVPIITLQPPGPKSDWLYELPGALNGVGLDPDMSPYPVRFRVERIGLNASPWQIADDAYARVVPAQAVPNDPTEKNAGMYWVVYLEAHPNSTRPYDLKVMNTVTGASFWLSGPEKLPVIDDLALNNYTNFRNLSMASLGGSINHYRLVFEGEKIEPSVTTATSKPNLDVLGGYLDYSVPEYAGHFSIIANATYVFNMSTYNSVEREPTISQDGHYVVYEVENRITTQDSKIHDRTRVWIKNFNELDLTVSYIYGNTSAD